MSSTPVMELDRAYLSHLPVAAQIGLRLIANENLLQQTPFLSTKKDLIPSVLAAEIGMDPAKTEDLNLVKNGITQLRKGRYLGFSTLELPVDRENFKHEPEEVTEMHIQLSVLPAFEHIMQGTAESAQEAFPSEA